MEIINKVKDILINNTNLEYRDGHFYGEIYVDCRDMYIEDKETLKEYIKGGREYIEEQLMNILCECDSEDFGYVHQIVRENLSKEEYEENFDIIQDYLIDNISFYLPSEFIWGTEVPTNILITAYDDWNFEFTQNTFHKKQLLEGGVSWLIQQQGYKVSDFEDEVFNKEEFSNIFFKSLYQEIIDTTTDLNALTVSVKMTLKEFIDMKESLENKTLKELQISKYCDIGLVDFWLGAGGVLEIALEKDLVIPLENIYQIDCDYNFCYGISEIYGHDCNSYWNYNLVLA